MKLIRSSVKILEPQGIHFEDIYKRIEECGRVSYKSEDRITEDSAVKFVEMLKDNKHGSVLEHGTVYLDIPSWRQVESEINLFINNPYTKIKRLDTNNLLVTTNYRVYYENRLTLIPRFNDSQYKRYTIKFICDRGISHELVRHRKFSFTQESTRYCNYSKNKFGNEITYILPDWLDDRYLNNSNYENIPLDASLFLEGLKQSEDKYFQLLNNGWKPEQARNILPNALKTEVVMTGFLEDWEYFFKLRCANNAHPQMRKLARVLLRLFKEHNLIKDNFLSDTFQ